MPKYMIDPGDCGAGPVNRAVISLTTGLEDPEKVTVALLVAAGASPLRASPPGWPATGARRSPI